MKKAFIFDLDGTLIDSSSDLALAINLMLTQLDRPSYNEEAIHEWVGNGAKALVHRALSGAVEVDERLADEFVDEALRVFLNFYADNLTVNTRVYPHVIDTLTALQAAGFQLALVTNKPIKFVPPILAALGLQAFFTVVLGGDSLSERKPHAMPLLHVCEQLGITPAECTMVGDSKNDILAAKACGMSSIGVTYGYNYGEDIAVYAPDYRIDDFRDVLTCV